MFMLMACLVGGFANSANAQGDKKPEKVVQPTQPTQPTQPAHHHSAAVGVNPVNPVITRQFHDYETAVGKCESINQSIEKVKKELNKRKDSGRRTGSYQNGKKGSVVSTFPGAESKEQLISKLNNLQSEYSSWYQSASRLESKLDNELNGLDSDYKDKYGKLKTRFSNLPTPTK